MSAEQEQDYAPDAIADGEIVQHIPLPIATFGLGLIALGVAIMAWLPTFWWMAYGALPVTFLLFLVTAMVTIGATDHAGKALFGVLLALLAVALCCLQLLLDPSHPWVA